MRLVGSGLGRSRGRCSSAPSFHTRPSSLRNGKDRVSEALGERSGASEGDVRLESAMSKEMKTGRGGYCPSVLPAAGELLTLLGSVYLRAGHSLSQ